VINQSDDHALITLSAVVVDAGGVVRAKLEGNSSDLVAGESEVFHGLRHAGRCRFWDVNDPYLYRVYTILTVDDKWWTFARRRPDFARRSQGGVGTGGVWLNGRFLWLTGYAQRAANDWPGVGGRIRIGCTISPCPGAREQWQLCPLDAHLAQRATSGMRPFWHRGSLPGGDQEGTATDGSGSSAPR